ncbi:Tetratricopeptide-like helical domain containing protein [Parasponia andersonii]|uniref:Tetratricopeptide-like helical domain containing protein n=1 Tax=Parasponia andersonii TaxID=3476 RepID=A0A2P5AL19_PARAD|nr:Tetratricopeptide-like helical domain containing protein [Parasponia andersonii]
MLPPGSEMWNAQIRNFSVGARHNEALSLFLGNLRCSLGFKPNHLVLAAVLKSCAALFAINLGEALHGYTFKQGYISCQSISKALLNMYAKFGKLDDCKKLFGQVSYKDPVIWNIILSGFAGSRMHSNEVMKFFCAMHLGGDAKPNPITIATVLPVCARLGDLEAGKSLHTYVIKSGFEANNLVGNALVSMYSKCGLVYYDAYATFKSISQKDVVSWNAIIAGFSENGFIEDAFKLFNWMLKGPTKPNNVTIATILPVYAFLDKNVAFHFGREIHCYVLRQTELVEDVFVCNSLVSFYLRLGKMEEAECLFQRMKSRDLISWNAIIAGYASNREWLKAVDLFRRLLSLDTIRPDSVTLVSILPACAQLQNIQIGKRIHGYIFRHFVLLDDTLLENAMISFYAKCNDVIAAYQIFSMMSRRDLISWNSMLDAFAENRCDTEFLNLLRMMCSEGMRPDSITILAIIRYCVNVSKIEKIKESHGYSIKAGYLLGDIQPSVGNAILDAYAKCGDVEHAYKIFQSLSDKRNLVSYNSMIAGYVNCGSHDNAYMIFNKMSETDLTTWNLMVRVYAENDCPGQALHLFHELQAQGRRPDAMSIMSLIPVCAQMASVHLVRQCHGHVVRSCFDDVRMTGALLDVYAKCGAIESAYMIYQSNPQKDLVMFTAMIGGFAMHGMGKEALSIFCHMLDMGLKPDHVIITAVLSACSHAGLVSEGLKIFYSIEEVHGLKPTLEQYACVVDLLARGGQIDDAFYFVNNMPIDANANIWGTLLGACRVHHKVELGCIAADRLFELEADNIGNYVVMSNLYAAEARWDGVMEVRRLMRTRDVRKPAGCSWIEIESTRNAFIAGDFSHPERSFIYSTLRTLDQQIKNQFSYDLVNV